MYFKSMLCIWTKTLMETPLSTKLGGATSLWLWHGYCPSDAISMHCELEHDNKLMQTANTHTVIFLQMEVYQQNRKAFELLTNVPNKRGKYLLHINVLKEDNAYSKNIIERAAKIFTFTGSIPGAIMIMQR